MTIDGYDIESTFGLTLAGGHYNSLGNFLIYPKRKALLSNDWAEENGVEVDASEVDLEPRKVSLYFGLVGDSSVAVTANYEYLWDLLTATGYRTFADVVPGLTYKMRYTGASGFKMSRMLGGGANHLIMQVDMIEDEWAGKDMVGAASGSAPAGLLSIGGTDIGLFGCGLDERMSDYFNYAGVKPPFTDGNQYYLDVIRTTSKSIKFPMWMIADTKAAFMGNYLALSDALFGSSGLKMLHVGYDNCNVEVYYSGCSSFKVARWSDTKVCARFTVDVVAPVFMN
jgi:hypothetical protein